MIGTSATIKFVYAAVVPLVFEFLLPNLNDQIDKYCRGKGRVNAEDFKDLVDKINPWRDSIRSTFYNFYALFIISALELEKTLDSTGQTLVPWLGLLIAFLSPLALHKLLPYMTADNFHFWYWRYGLGIWRAVFYIFNACFVFRT